MSNIFEIQQDLLRVFNTIEDNDGEVTDEIMEALAIKQDELKLKIKSYANLVKLLETDVKLIKEEKDRLTALQKSKQRTLERLKKLMIEAIENFGDSTKTGSKFIDYGTGKVSVRTSKVVDIDEDSINRFFGKYLSGLAYYDMQNQLDMSILNSQDLIDYANNQDSDDMDNESTNFTLEDLEQINGEFEFELSIKDLITSKEGFELAKALIHYSIFKHKGTVNKTNIKNNYKTSNKLPSFANIVDSKSITIK